MVEARVEYDYNAENVDELTLRTGDLITNVVQKDDGWWEGKLNGKYGLFPENFVKIFNKDQAKVQSDLKSNGIPFRTDKKRKCRVVYSYTPVNDDELELEVDSLIDVLEEVEEGWWRGILNGKMGVFPSNFVEELQDRPSSSRDSRNSKESSSSDAQDKYLYKDNTDSSSKDIKPKPVRGVGLGNIIFQDECSRIKQTQDSSTEKKGTPPKKPPPPTHLPAVNDAPVLPPKPGSISTPVWHLSFTPEYSKHAETSSPAENVNYIEDHDDYDKNNNLQFISTQSSYVARPCSSELDLRLPLHLLDGHTSSSNDTNGKAYSWTSPDSNSPSDMVTDDLVGDSLPEDLFSHTETDHITDNSSESGLWVSLASYGNLSTKQNSENFQNLGENPNENRILNLNKSLTLNNDRRLQDSLESKFIQSSKDISSDFTNKLVKSKFGESKRTIQFSPTVISLNVKDRNRKKLEIIEKISRNVSKVKKRKKKPMGQIGVLAKKMNKMNKLNKKFYKFLQHPYSISTSSVINSKTSHKAIAIRKGFILRSLQTPAISQMDLLTPKNSSIKMRKLDCKISPKTGNSEKQDCPVIIHRVECSVKPTHLNNPPIHVRVIHRIQKGSQQLGKENNCLQKNTPKKKNIPHKIYPLISGNQLCFFSSPKDLASSRSLISFCSQQNKRMNFTLEPSSKTLKVYLNKRNKSSKPFSHNQKKHRRFSYHVFKNKISDSYASDTVSTAYSTNEKDLTDESILKAVVSCPVRIEAIPKSAEELHLTAEKCISCPGYCCLPPAQIDSKSLPKISPECYSNSKTTFCLPLKPDEALIPNCCSLYRLVTCSTPRSHCTSDSEIPTGVSCQDFCSVCENGPQKKRSDCTIHMKYIRRPSSDEKLEKTCLSARYQYFGKDSVEQKCTQESVNMTDDKEIVNENVHKCNSAAFMHHEITTRDQHFVDQRKLKVVQSEKNVTINKDNKNLILVKDALTMADVKRNNLSKLKKWQSDPCIKSKLNPNTKKIIYETVSKDGVQVIRMTSGADRKRKKKNRNGQVVVEKSNMQNQKKDAGCCGLKWKSKAVYHISESDNDDGEEDSFPDAEDSKISEEKISPSLHTYGERVLISRDKIQSQINVTSMPPPKFILPPAAEDVGKVIVPSNTQFTVYLADTKTENKTSANTNKEKSSAKKKNVKKDKEKKSTADVPDKDDDEEEEENEAATEDQETSEKGSTTADADEQSRERAGSNASEEEKSSESPVEKSTHSTFEDSQTKSSVKESSSKTRTSNKTRSSKNYPENESRTKTSSSKKCSSDEDRPKSSRKSSSKTYLARSDVEESQIRDKHSDEEESKEYPSRRPSAHSQSEEKRPRTSVKPSSYSDVEHTRPRHSQRSLIYSAPMETKSRSSLQSTVRRSRRPSRSSMISYKGDYHQYSDISEDFSDNIYVPEEEYSKIYFSKRLKSSRNISETTSESESYTESECEETVESEETSVSEETESCEETTSEDECNINTEEVCECCDGTGCDSYVGVNNRCESNKPNVDYCDTTKTSRKKKSQKSKSRLEPICEETEDEDVKTSTVKKRKSKSAKQSMYDENGKGEPSRKSYSKSKISYVTPRTTSLSKSHTALRRSSKASLKGPSSRRTYKTYRSSQGMRSSKNKSKSRYGEPYGEGDISKTKDYELERPRTSKTAYSYKYPSRRSQNTNYYYDAYGSRRTGSPTRYNRNENYSSRKNRTEHTNDYQSAKAKSSKRTRQEDDISDKDYTHRSSRTRSSKRYNDYDYRTPKSRSSNRYTPNEDDELDNDDSSKVHYYYDNGSPESRSVTSYNQNEDYRSQRSRKSKPNYYDGGYASQRSRSAKNYDGPSRSKRYNSTEYQGEVSEEEEYDSERYPNLHSRYENDYERSERYDEEAASEIGEDESEEEYRSMKRSSLGPYYDEKHSRKRYIDEERTQRSRLAERSQKSLRSKSRKSLESRKRKSERELSRKTRSEYSKKKRKELGKKERYGRQGVCKRAICPCEPCMIAANTCPPDPCPCMSKNQFNTCQRPPENVCCIKKPDLSKIVGKFIPGTNLIQTNKEFTPTQRDTEKTLVILEHPQKPRPEKPIVNKKQQAIFICKEDKDSTFQIQEASYLESAPRSEVRIQKMKLPSLNSDQEEVKKNETSEELICICKSQSKSRPEPKGQNPTVKSLRCVSLNNKSQPDIEEEPETVCNSEETIVRRLQCICCGEKLVMKANEMENRNATEASDICPKVKRCLIIKKQPSCGKKMNLTRNQVHESLTQLCDSLELLNMKKQIQHQTDILRHLQSSSGRCENSEAQAMVPSICCLCDVCKSCNCGQHIFMINPEKNESESDLMTYCYEEKEDLGGQKNTPVKEINFKPKLCSECSKSSLNKRISHEIKLPECLLNSHISKLSKGLISNSEIPNTPVCSDGDDNSNQSEYLCHCIKTPKSSSPKSKTSDPAPGVTFIVCPMYSKRELYMCSPHQPLNFEIEKKMQNHMKNSPVEICSWQKANEMINAIALSNTDDLELNENKSFSSPVYKNVHDKPFRKIEHIPYHFDCPNKKEHGDHLSTKKIDDLNSVEQYFHNLHHLLAETFSTNLPMKNLQEGNVMVDKSDKFVNECREELNVQECREEEKKTKQLDQHVHRMQRNVPACEQKVESCETQSKREKLLHHAKSEGTVTKCDIDSDCVGKVKNIHDSVPVFQVKERVNDVPLTTVETCTNAKSPCQEDLSEIFIPCSVCVKPHCKACSAQNTSPCSSAVIMPCNENCYSNFISSVAESQVEDKWMAEYTKKFADYINNAKLSQNRDDPLNSLSCNPLEILPNVSNNQEIFVCTDSFPSSVQQCTEEQLQSQQIECGNVDSNYHLKKKCDFESQNKNNFLVLDSTDRDHKAKQYKCNADCIKGIDVPLEQQTKSVIYGTQEGKNNCFMVCPVCRQLRRAKLSCDHQLRSEDIISYINQKKLFEQKNMNPGRVRKNDYIQPHVPYIIIRCPQVGKCPHCIARSVLQRMQEDEDEVNQHPRKIARKQTNVSRMKCLHVKQNLDQKTRETDKKYEKCPSIILRQNQYQPMVQTQEDNDQSLKFSKSVKCANPIPKNIIQSKSSDQNEESCSCNKTVTGIVSTFNREENINSMQESTDGKNKWNQNHHLCTNPNCEFCKSYKKETVPSCDKYLVPECKSITSPIPKTVLPCSSISPIIERKIICDKCKNEIKVNEDDFLKAKPNVKLCIPESVIVSVCPSKEKNDLCICNHLHGRYLVRECECKRIGNGENLDSSWNYKILKAGENVVLPCASNWDRKDSKVEENVVLPCTPSRKKKVDENVVMPCTPNKERRSYQVDENVVLPCTPNKERRSYQVDENVVLPCTPNKERRSYQVDENVVLPCTPNKERRSYQVDENVVLPCTPNKERRSYQVDENVVLPCTPNKERSYQVDENVILSCTPSRDRKGLKDDKNAVLPCTRSRDKNSYKIDENVVLPCCTPSKDPKGTKVDENGVLPCKSNRDQKGYKVVENVLPCTSSRDKNDSKVDKNIVLICTQSKDRKDSKINETILPCSPSNETTVFPCPKDADDKFSDVFDQPSNVPNTCHYCSRVYQTLSALLKEGHIRPCNNEICVNKNEPAICPYCNVMLSCPGISQLIHQNSSICSSLCPSLLEFQRRSYINGCPVCMRRNMMTENYGFNQEINCPCNRNVQNISNLSESPSENLMKEFKFPSSHSIHDASPNEVIGDFEPSSVNSNNPLSSCFSHVCERDVISRCTDNEKNDCNNSEAEILIGAQKKDPYTNKCKSQANRLSTNEKKLLVKDCGAETENDLMQPHICNCQFCKTSQKDKDEIQYCKPTHIMCDKNIQVAECPSEEHAAVGICSSQKQVLKPSVCYHCEDSCTVPFQSDTYSSVVKCAPSNSTVKSCPNSYENKSCAKFPQKNVKQQPYDFCLPYIISDEQTVKPCGPNTSTHNHIKSPVCKNETATTLPVKVCSQDVCGLKEANGLSVCQTSNLPSSTQIGWDDVHNAITACGFPAHNIEATETCCPSPSTQSEIPNLFDQILNKLFFFLGSKKTSSLPNIQQTVRECSSEMCKIESICSTCNRSIISTDESKSICVCPYSVDLTSVKECESCTQSSSVCNDPSCVCNYSLDSLNSLSVQSSSDKRSHQRSPSGYVCSQCSAEITSWDSLSTCNCSSCILKAREQFSNCNIKKGKIDYNSSKDSYSVICPYCRNSMSSHSISTTDTRSISCPLVKKICSTSENNRLSAGMVRNFYLTNVIRIPQDIFSQQTSSSSNCEYFQTNNAHCLDSSPKCESLNESSSQKITVLTTYHVSENDSNEGKLNLANIKEKEVSCREECSYVSVCQKKSVETTCEQKYEIDSEKFNESIDATTQTISECIKQWPTCWEFASNSMIEFPYNLRDYCSLTRVPVCEIENNTQQSRDTTQKTNCSLTGIPPKFPDARMIVKACPADYVKVCQADYVKACPTDCVKHCPPDKMKKTCSVTGSQNCEYSCRDETWTDTSLPQSFRGQNKANSEANCTSNYISPKSGAIFSSVQKSERAHKHVKMKPCSKHELCRKHQMAAEKYEENMSKIHHHKHQHKHRNLTKEEKHMVEYDESHKIERCKEEIKTYSDKSESTKDDTNNNLEKSKDKSLCLENTPNFTKLFVKKLLNKCPSSVPDSRLLKYVEPNETSAKRKKDKEEKPDPLWTNNCFCSNDLTDSCHNDQHKNEETMDELEDIKTSQRKKKHRSHAGHYSRNINSTKCKKKTACKGKHSNANSNDTDDDSDKMEADYQINSKKCPNIEKKCSVFSPLEELRSAGPQLPNHLVQNNKTNKLNYNVEAQCSLMGIPKDYRKLQNYSHAENYPFIKSEYLNSKKVCKCDKKKNRFRSGGNLQSKIHFERQSSGSDNPRKKNSSQNNLLHDSVMQRRCSIGDIEQNYQIKNTSSVDFSKPSSSKYCNSQQTKCEGYINSDLENIKNEIGPHSSVSIEKEERLEKGYSETLQQVSSEFLNGESNNKKPPVKPKRKPIRFCSLTQPPENLYSCSVTTTHAAAQLPPLPGQKTTEKSSSSTRNKPEAVELKQNNKNYERYKDAKIETFATESRSLSSVSLAKNKKCSFGTIDISSQSPDDLRAYFLTSTSELKSCRGENIHDTDGQHCSVTGTVNRRATNETNENVVEMNQDLMFANITPTETSQNSDNGSTKEKKIKSFSTTAIPDRCEELVQQFKSHQVPSPLFKNSSYPPESYMNRLVQINRISPTVRSLDNKYRILPASVTSSTSSSGENVLENESWSSHKQLNFEFREQARVLFAYDACNDDELSLREGDIITVISKEIEDKGWWKGELNNKIGVFPDNFVEVITLPEPRLKKPERPSLINKSASSRIIASDVVEKTSDASPPLPDYPKKLSTEILKKDDRPERPEKPLIPPIPCKKPQIPPPLKKPQKPIAPPPPVETLTDDMKAKTQGTNIMETTAAMVDEAAFDSVELTSDKLTHLTATRVRHPHRRPPSHIFLKDTSSSVTDSQFNEVLRGRETKNTDHNSNSLSAQLNTHKEFIYENEEQLIKNEHVVDQERPTFPFLKRELPEKPVLRPPLPKPSAETVESQSTPAKTKPYGLPPKPSTLPKEEAVSKPLMQDTRLNKTSGDDVSVVLELQQEIMHLKNQILNLQQNLDNCNATYSDKIEALSQELIAEKKIRISMQVEIEHLKKMVKEH